MRSTNRRTLSSLLACASALAVVVAGAAACDSPGQPIDTGEPAAPLYDATFVGGAFAAMEVAGGAGCGRTGCHDATTNAGLLQLPGAASTLSTSAAYTAVIDGGASNMSSINTADPPNSLLLTKGAGDGHGGQQIWEVGDDEYDGVLGWIVAGAPPP